MKRLFFAFLLAFFAVTPVHAANFYWKASTTDLNAIAAPSAGDRGIVITDAGAVSYWTYSGSAWVQAYDSFPDLDDLPGDTVDDNLIDVGLIADLGPMIHGKTSKETPVDADEIPLSDSADTNALKKLTWANLKATLNSVYAAVTGTSSSTFQVGTDGPKLKNSSGTMEARNAADDAYADIKAKDGYFAHVYSTASNGAYYGNWDNTTAITFTPAQGDFWSESGVLKFRDATTTRNIYHSGNLVYPVTGPASPTAGNLTKWDSSGQVLVDGPKIGTFTDAKWCSFSTAGGLQCTETIPQAALTNPVTGPASPTAGYLTKWGPSGQALVDGPKIGTFTDAKWCSYSTAGGLQCTETIPQTALTMATASDINAGIDTAKPLTSDALAGSNLGIKEIGWTIKDSDVATAVADGKQAFVVPAAWNGMNLVDLTCAVADLNSAASGTTTVVLRRVRGATAVDMTSTGVTINYNEYSASDETVDTANDDIQTGDKIYVDVNAITTAAQKGLSCTASFQLP